MQNPIAVVGMGCRFPGIDTPAAFWHAVCNEVDGIGELSLRRRELGDFAGMTADDPYRRGGFLQDVDRFDAQFFGIPPREAAHLDPQFRLLLEVAWEAIEDAGWVPESLSGTRTGVFVGMSNRDYAVLASEQPVEDAFASTGTSTCMAANRVSYHLDLRGPSVVVNTACSSSLVALDRACQSVWLGESVMALAGGVNLILRSQSTYNLSRAGLLSKHGRCRTFSAEADGYVRSEGAGIVALKPLARARADGDRIYAVIRSSSTNSNGRSNGIAAPNPQAQTDLIQFTYALAGVDPATIDYVEVQGTGTQMGDALELKALGAALDGAGRRDRPCAVGTVKTNIGHTESAAGIAGAIEAILALYHRQLPPNLHFHPPNPLVPFESLSLVVQERLEPWPQSDRPARAGVSAFGFGGTNAHVLLEEAFPPEQAPPVPLANRPDAPQAYLLTLSAKNESSLRALADRYRVLLADAPDLALADLCATASTRRSQFKHRFTTVARSTAELQARLEAFTAGTLPSEVRYAKVARRKRPPVAFVFSGRGDRWRALSHYLYATQSVFREACDRCFHPLDLELESPSLAKWLARQPDERAIAFVMEYALACLWQHWGICPAAAIGTSEVGAYGAACCAGILTLPQALALIAEGAEALDVIPQPPRIPLLDAATGNPVSAERLLETEYWRDRDNLPFPGDLGDFFTLSISAPPDEPERVAASEAWHQVLDTIAALWRSGADICWPEVYPNSTFCPVTLPTYAFDRQSYWVERPAPATSPVPPESPVSAAPPAIEETGREPNPTAPAIAYERPELDTLFAAPQNDTERQLAELWQGLFGLERVGVRDSFFDLGGDSLLSIRLFADIENTFHCKLSLAEISGDLTVETLANDLIRQGAVRPTAPSTVPLSVPRRSAPHGMSAIDYHTLMSLSAGRRRRRVSALGLACELQAGNADRPPLIAIGAKLGNWAADFGDRQTVYGLPSTWMVVRNPSTYIRSLAALYADEIQSAQPEGPYFLLGYCFEGWIAFEVAHQLRDRGQDIGLLAILDRDAPEPDPFYRKRAKSLVKYSLARSLHRWDEWRSQLGLDDASAKAYRKRMTPHIIAALGQTIRSYRPRPYPGDVTLFLSTPYADRYERNPQAGWGELVTGRLDVHRVEAKHLDVIQSPHKERAIAIIQARVAEAHARHARGSTEKLSGTQDTGASDRVCQTESRSH